MHLQNQLKFLFLPVFFGGGEGFLNQPHKEWKTHYLYCFHQTHRIFYFLKHFYGFGERGATERYCQFTAKALTIKDGSVKTHTAERNSNNKQKVTSSSTPSQISS